MRVRWLNGLGSFGALFAAKCPVCGPAIGAVFSAIGLGFLAKNTYLQWFSAAFLGIGVIALYKNYQRHGIRKHVIIGAATSLIMFISLYTVRSTTVVYASAGVLLVNAFLDYKKAKMLTCCKNKKRKL